MKIIKHHSQRDALDFFERLGAYSADYVRSFLPSVHHSWPSNNLYGKWDEGCPIGAILHYTAGVNYASAIRHFVEGKRASAHWVVSKTLDRRADALREQYDLSDDLRADACQVISPSCPAWHAGWVNRFLLGVEVRNAGVLRPYPKDPPRGMPRKPPKVDMSRADFFAFKDWDVDDLDFYWYPEGWTYPFNGEVLKVGGSWWESWSRGSVATAIVLLRYANSINQMDPTWFLAHHNTKSTKNDIVLPLPLDKVRDAVLFDSSHVDEIEWLSEFDDSEDGYEEVDDPWMIRDLDRIQSDRAEEDLDGFDRDDDEGFSTSPRTRFASQALRMLGYYVPEDDESRFIRAVRIYQKSRNLTVDGDVGTQTTRALNKDLEDWGLEIQ